jgi:tetratricopeptide (TPR) repeat protein
MSAKAKAPAPNKSPILTPEQAVTFYEDLIKENPDDASPYLELGVAHYVAHQWDEAISALEKAVQLDPKLGHAHYYLGVLYAAKGDHARAEQELLTVLQVSQNPILRAQAEARIPAIKSMADLGIR